MTIIAAQCPHDLTIHFCPVCNPLHRNHPAVAAVNPRDPHAGVPTVVQAPVGTMGVCLRCGEPYAEGDMIKWDARMAGWVCEDHALEGGA